jgi:hypothetical protein
LGDSNIGKRIFLFFSGDYTAQGYKPNDGQILPHTKGTGSSSDCQNARLFSAKQTVAKGNRNRRKKLGGKLSASGRKT